MELFKYLDLQNPVNPCWLVTQPGGRFILKHRLRLSGYAAKNDVLDATVEALFNNEIILLEGKPGAGKTMLYDAMVKAFNLPDYQVRCNVETSHFNIIGNFESTLQNQYVIQTTNSTDRSFDEIAKEQWSRNFFRIAQPLRAYLDSPVVSPDDKLVVPNGLLLDEIDKLTETVQDSCLQLFNDRAATIDDLLPNPRLSMPTGALPPFVVFTSNNMRGGVSAPLRDRAGVYLHIETPTPQEEYVIMKTKFPQIGDVILRQTLKLIKAIRDDDLIKQKPQIRAASKFMTSIIKWRIEDFSAGLDGNPQRNVENAIRSRIGYLVKLAPDFINAKSSIASYAAAVHRRSSFDEILDQGEELYNAGQREHEREVENFKNGMTAASVSGT